MKEPRIYLEHILQNITHVQRLASKGKQTLFDDPDTSAAVLYYLQTLAESTARLPESLKDMQPQISWSQIKGFRNIVVHDYLSVDLDRVWNIIQFSLPDLMAAIIAMLAALDKKPGGSDKDQP
jgi:uncharacterized protein with HEPN domain